MRRVEQRGSNDCGVACVAMLAQVSYPVAKKAIHGDGPTSYTSTKQLVNALRALGKWPKADRLTRFGKDGRRAYRELPFNALLKVRRGQSINWHWIVWDLRRQDHIDPGKRPQVRPNVTAYLKVD